MTKKIIKYVCILACMISACFSLCISVLAETATYTVFGNECYLFSNGVNYKYSYVSFVNSNSDIRAVRFKRTGASSDRIYFISLNTFNWANWRSNSALACPSNHNSVVDHVTSPNDYYYAFIEVNNSKVYGEWADNFNVPIIYLDHVGNQTDGYNYTFGSSSVGPIEPTNWGQLRNVEYSTNIAGSGDASLSNLDTIKWSTDYDTFGNVLTDACMVEIRAVRGSWSGNTKEDLLNLAGDSMVLESTVAPVLATLPVNTGSFSIEWDEVIEELDITQYISLLARLNPDTQTYLKEGWIYEIRLVNETDNYTGTWQKIYTATSGTAVGSESIINNGDSFNTFIYQELQQIGILNNQPTTIVIINNTQYPVENPNNGVPPESDPDDPDGDTQTILDDLWELIKIIQQGFYNVVNAITSIPGKFLEMFESLFTLGEVDQSVTNQITSIQEDYVSEKQENALNTLNVLEDIQEDLHAAAGSAHECIFEWDDVALRIPGTSSNMVLIPAGTYNFTSAFLQMIAGFGMTYQQYQDLVSAVIYCLTALFVYHHVTTFLRGE